MGRSPETPKVKTFDSALQLEAKILSNALHVVAAWSETPFRNIDGRWPKTSATRALEFSFEWLVTVEDRQHGFGRHPCGLPSSLASSARQLVLKSI